MPSTVRITTSSAAAVQEGDVVAGTVILEHDKPMHHDGVSVLLLGRTVLEASAKHVGLFDALSAQPEPVTSISRSVQLLAPGTLAPPRTCLEFSVPLVPNKPSPLVETYRGRIIRTSYVVSVDVTRGLAKRTLSASAEVAVKCPAPATRAKPRPHRLRLTRDLAPAELARLLPRVDVCVDLPDVEWDVDADLRGTVLVRQSEGELEAVNLQLVRFEQVAWDEEDIWEESEVQTVQLCQGNVPAMRVVPFSVSFPRFVCAPTVARPEFAVTYALRALLVLRSGHVISDAVAVVLRRH